MKEISDRMTNLTPADTTSAAGSREAAWEGWKKAEWSQIPLPSREMQPEQGTPWQPVQERGGTELPQRSRAEAAPCSYSTLEIHS